MEEKPSFRPVQQFKDDHLKRCSRIIPVGPNRDEHLTFDWNFQNCWHKGEHAKLLTLSKRPTWHGRKISHLTHVRACGLRFRRVQKKVQLTQFLERSINCQRLFQLLWFLARSHKSLQRDQYPWDVLEWRMGTSAVLAVSRSKLEIVRWQFRRTWRSLAIKLLMYRYVTLCWYERRYM